MNGQPWTFEVSNIGAIDRVTFEFADEGPAGFAGLDLKTTGIGVAFDNLKVAAVPLPAPALLLLAGLAGLTLARRRQAR